MNQHALRVSRLGKQYKIGDRQKARPTLLSDALASSVKAAIQRLRKPAGQEPNDTTIWALKDVSFEVNQGEVIGIIGRNGTGKSTLLKILSRITTPTEGRVELRGRVGALLEVGTGFHPELTGRQNVYLNGAILGMRQAEIRRKFDEIVAFAEVEKFIDTPVKRYSSGMYMRLAFSVAAHLEPEVLLIDEVLAVGDFAFQKKSLAKMEDVAQEGRTVIFVSHNIPSIQYLCERTILLNNGSVVEDGPTPDVVKIYLNRILPDAMSESLEERSDRNGSGNIRFTSLHLEDSQGNRLASAQSGQDIDFVFGYRCRAGLSARNVSVGFGLFTREEQLLFVLYSSYTGQDLDSVPPSGYFRCTVPHLPLSEGQYRVEARVVEGGTEADWPHHGIGYIDVVPGDYFGTGKAGFGGSAPFLVSGSWSVSEGK